MPKLGNVKDRDDSSIGGTPVQNRRTNTLRSSAGKSVGNKFGNTKARMGNSVSNFGDAKSMKSGSVRDQKEDDFDLEDFGDIMEMIQLQGKLEEKKREVKKIK